MQGWNKRPRSLLWSLEYLDQLGILKKYDYLAIANLCVELNLRILRDSVLYVYHWLRDRGYANHRIHIFGMKIAALDLVENYITSFDSKSDTKPATTRLQRVMNWSCKTQDECTLYFCEFLLRLTKNRVILPIEPFLQCLEQLPRIRRVLMCRYRDRAEKIMKLLNEIEKDLEKFRR